MSQVIQIGDFVLGPYNQLLLVEEIDENSYFCSNNDGQEFDLELNQISLHEKGLK